MHAFDYAIVRVVPRVERGEFLNCGVILFSSTQAWLGARVELDHQRLRALDPTIDCDLVTSHLESIPRICAGGDDAGPIGLLPQRARFHWLVAPRSTVVQMSPVHSGIHDDLDAALENLFNRLVRLPGSR